MSDVGCLMSEGKDRCRREGTDVGGRMSDVGGRREGTEVRGRRSEVREGTEVGGLMSEGKDRGRRSDV
jgi:hypothetical protein